MRHARECRTQRTLRKFWQRAQRENVVWRVRQSRFPVSLFLACLGIILLAVGVQSVLLSVTRKLTDSYATQMGVVFGYWSLVAAALTVYIRWQIKIIYEEPMKMISEAASQVAKGDFSVYIPPLHTADKLDYLDTMIMDLNKMIEDLGSMETLQTDFFSNVSHEIKTPLSVIQNSAELLRQKDMSEQQQEYTDTIIQQSRRLAELINNLLKLNKLEKQVIMPAAHQYDLCEQLAESALLFEDVWEKKLNFDVQMEDGVFIAAEESLMSLVWNNLFSNAVKFTKEGGSVTLLQTSDENNVKVTIADTGCGMDEETMRHIFEKFYQGDASHSTEGNGLGLALVTRILQLHGFSIEVESQPEEGSAFTVVIPRKMHSINLNKQHGRTGGDFR